MQSPACLTECNVNLVWLCNSSLCTKRKTKKNKRVACICGFTFTITLMIQSSLIIMPLPGMSAPIENSLYTVHIKQLLGRPGTTLQARWFTQCPDSLSSYFSLSLSVCVSLFLSLSLSFFHRTQLLWTTNSLLSASFSVFHTLTPAVCLSSSCETQKHSPLTETGPSVPWPRWKVFVQHHSLVMSWVRSRGLGFCELTDLCWLNQFGLKRWRPKTPVEFWMQRSVI